MAERVSLELLNVLLLNLLHVLPRLLLLMGISQEKGRMIGGHHLNSAAREEPSSQLGDLFIGLEQGLGRESPQGADDFGLDNLKLFVEERFTGSDFFLLRISIMGRSTFNNIGNIDLFPPEANGIDDSS